MSKYPGPRLLAWLLLALWPGLAAWAQSDPAESQGPSVIAIEQLQHQLDNLAADDSISGDRKKELTGLYRKAIGNLLLRDEAVAETVKARSIQNNGPKTIAGITARLASGNSGKILQDSELLNASDPDLVPPEQGLILIENRTETLVQQSAEQKRSLRELQDSSLPLSSQLAEARLRLRELTALGQPDAGSSPLETPNVAARAALQQTEKLLVEARIDMLEQQLLARDVRMKLVQSRIALAERQVSLLEEQAKTLREILQQRRRAIADAVQSNIARLEAFSADTRQLKTLVSSNAALVEELDGISARQQQLANQLNQLSDQQLRVETSLDNVQQILSVRASGAEVGQLLSKEYSQMPDLKTLRHELKGLQNQGIGVRLRRLQIQDEQRHQEYETALEQLLTSLPQQNQAEFRVLATESTRLREGLLEDSAAAYKSFLSTIEVLELGYSRLIRQVGQLNKLLEARLFWVRSAPPIGIDWWRELSTGVAWLLSPSSWGSVVRALAAGLQTTLVQSALILALLLALLANLRRMLQTMKTYTAVVGQYNDRFRYTLLTLVFTLLCAAPLPLSVFWAGYLLQSGSVPGSRFVTAVGPALIACAGVYYLFSVSRWLCHPGGMMRRHFGWAEHAQKILYRNLGWLQWVILGATFIVVGTLESGDDALINGLGRLFFMLASLSLAWAAHNILHPRRGALGDLVSRGGRLWQLRWFWFPWLVGIPLVLALLAASGFYFTASEIQDRAFTSGWLAFCAFISYGLALRWLLVANRKLAYIRALEQQARDESAEQARVAREQSGDARPAVLEIPTVTLDSISAQTRRLLRVFIGLGTIILLWAVWDDVVPALDFLNEFKLWTRPADADLAFAPGSVTLADLLYCLVTIAVTAVSARNLPGLMEVLFLSRLSVDAGTRYAVTTIARYLIVATGFFVAAGILGLDWSKMQWIVAALGVGLGFGLQEIVANFVSGLIILFERPVRVGDTVTVDGVDGTVSRLQIRATTITDWDNREILVPNKNFITGTVTNWTLTNPVNRLVVPVGIAYGSDTSKAQEVMLKAVKSIPLILNEPSPTVFFLGFGDSSLNYVVRAFVATLEDRLRGLHEVHSQVEKALRENGFVIPFPQRDVHLWPAPGGEAPPPRQNDS